MVKLISDNIFVSNKINEFVKLTALGGPLNSEQIID